MLYKILKQLVATIFKVYFRKIYLVGSEKIPKESPLLLSCNHPMAFTEACLLACFLDRPLHFLVRGDIFDSKWNWFLEKTHQIPIYRFRDGFKNMRRNADSFAWAHQALKDGKVILIFSEGNTKLQKKLSPLQKGVARLAFGAYEEKNVNNLKIVPIGVNYNNGTKFRSDVMLQVGDPIAIQDYLAKYEDDKNVATRDMTTDVHASMKPLVIHLEKDEDEPLASELFEALDAKIPDFPWPILDDDHGRFQREKSLADQINKTDNFTRETAQKMFSAHRDQMVFHSGWSKAWKLVILLILGPIAMIGFAVNAAPFYLAKYIAGNKVKKVEFYTPVRLGLLMILYLIWMGVALVVMSLCVGWKAWLLTLLLPISAYVTIIWWEGFCHYFIRKEDGFTISD